MKDTYNNVSENSNINNYQKSNLIYNNIQKRIMRIFISSTFLDMKEERNALMSRVFPKLMYLASKRDVTLIPLDLRWGITEDSIKNGKVIDICLNEINNSHPFFIGLIGNRYGSCIRTDELKKNSNLIKRCKWIEDSIDEEISITELEIQYGVLRNPNKISAFFYLKNENNILSDNAEKLKNLKNKIKEDGRYPIKRYNSIEQLSKVVENDFRKLLFHYFPEKEISNIDKKSIEQSALYEYKGICYIRRNEAHEELNMFCNNDLQYFVLTGESGLGKSTVLLNWIKESKNKNIIYHFIGNDDLSANYNNILKNIYDKICGLFNIEPVKHINKGKEEEEFENVLDKINSDNQLIIVIDGINQLIDEDNSKLLTWIPQKKNNIKYIFSTLKDDKTYNVLKEWKCSFYNLLPMNTNERNSFVKEYLRLYGKELSESRITRIVNDPQNKNTLVLRVLLDELITLGENDMLDYRIDHYLKANSIADFFQLVLNRIENEFGKDIIKDILSCIYFSESGITENEIIKMLNLNSYDWISYLSSFKNNIIVKNGFISFSHNHFIQACSNRYNNEEKRIRNIIIDFFKKNNTSRSIKELLYQYYKLSRYDDLYNLLITHNSFYIIYQKDECLLRKYWKSLFNADKNKYTIIKYLDNNLGKAEETAFFYNLVGEYFLDFSEDLESVYSILNKSLAFCKEKLSERHRITAIAYNNIGSYYNYKGDYNKAKEYYSKALEIRKYIFKPNHASIAHTYNNLGATYNYLSDYDKALECFEKSIKINKEHYPENHIRYANLYCNLGVLYSNKNDSENALYYYNRSLKINMKYYGDFHPKIAALYCNIGQIYLLKEDYLQAISFLEKSYEIYKTVLESSYKMIGHIFIFMSKTYSGLQKYEEAIKYYEKALDIFSFHDEKEMICNIYNMIGQMYYCISSYGKALNYFNKCLKLSIKIHKNNNNVTKKTLYLLGKTYSSLQNHNKAINYYKKSIEGDIAFIDYISDVYLSLSKEYFNLINHKNYLSYYKNVIKYSEKFLEITKTNNGTNNLNVFLTYLRMGNIYYIIHDFESALSYYKNALSTAKVNNDIDKDYINLVYSNINLCILNLNKKK